ncbi:MAG: hypothetical protein IJS97_05850 [Prevotella sp.]|nr:hypothetical protein [Prevotella sp.]
MRPLNKLQSILFVIGGMLMVIGTGCFVFLWQQRVVCWLFLLGAVLFSTIQATQLYEGTNFTVRRLKRIMNMADLFFVLAGILMVDSAWHFLLPLFTSHSNDGYFLYLQYVYNKWVVLLLIAAILEVYTMHRIASELEKDKKR